LKEGRGGESGIDAWRRKGLKERKAKRKLGGKRAKPQGQRVFELIIEPCFGLQTQSTLRTLHCNSKLKSVTGANTSNLPLPEAYTTPTRFCTMRAVLSSLPSFLVWLWS
jgi:hypothetical protein